MHPDIRPNWREGKRLLIMPFTFGKIATIVKVSFLFLALCGALVLIVA